MTVVIIDIYCHFGIIASTYVFPSDESVMKAVASCVHFNNESTSCDNVTVAKHSPGKREDYWLENFDVQVQIRLLQRGIFCQIFFRIFFHMRNFQDLLSVSYFLYFLCV